MKMTPLNRRHLLKYAPGAALVAATPALAAPSARARAEQLITELIEVLQSEAPEGSDFVAIGISNDLPLQTPPRVNAVFLDKNQRGTDVWKQLTA